MLALEAASVRERHQQQPENWRDLVRDDSLYLRRLMAIGSEMMVMTRVPALGWPSDLFVDAHAGVVV